MLYLKLKSRIPNYYTFCNLTLTSVVFETFSLYWISVIVIYLTLTSVVFENIQWGTAYDNTRYLTLTSVVFEISNKKEQNNIS